MARDINEKLRPKYWGKICGTTRFFIFMIKDAVECAEVLEDKKHIQVELKLIIYILKIYLKN